MMHHVVIKCPNCKSVEDFYCKYNYPTIPHKCPKCYELVDITDTLVESSTSDTDDQINPSHYKNGKMECWDAMSAAYSKEEMIAYAKISAFKYIWRAGHKGPADVDLRKAGWFLDKAAGLIEASKGETK